MNNKIDISINMDMPNKVDDNYKYKDLYEKVYDYIDVCESDMDSEYHWRYLKCLYEKLVKLPRLPMGYHRLFDLLQEFLNKHAGYGSGENFLDLEGVDMFKHKNQDEEY